MDTFARCERGCDPPRPATLLIRARLEWHPCCDDCAEWWADHRKAYLATPRGAVSDCAPECVESGCMYIDTHAEVERLDAEVQRLRAEVVRLTTNRGAVDLPGRREDPAELLDDALRFMEQVHKHRLNPLMEARVLVEEARRQLTDRGAVDRSKERWTLRGPASGPDIAVVVAGTVLGPGEEVEVVPTPPEGAV